MVCLHPIILGPNSLQTLKHKNAQCSQHFINTTIMQPHPQPTKRQYYLFVWLTVVGELIF